MSTMLKNKLLIFLLIALLIGTLSGCSKDKISSDGYQEVIKLTGSSDAQSEYIMIKSEAIRVKYKTSGDSKSGINCQIIDKNEKVLGAFGTGADQTEDSNTYNIQPGEYAIKVQSTGMQYEIVVEAKVK